MNYKYHYHNEIEFGIEETDEDIGSYDDFQGDYYVVNTFTEAKSALLEILRNKRNYFSQMIKAINKTKLKNIS